jgi:hypothetical protein
MDAELERARQQPPGQRVDEPQIAGVFDGIGPGRICYVFVHDGFAMPLRGDLASALGKPVFLAL